MNIRPIQSPLEKWQEVVLAVAKPELLAKLNQPEWLMAAVGKNCELMVGEMTLPLAVAGPLVIEKTSYYVPLATTEGALVASIQRGMKATKTDGVTTVVTSERISRSPIFKVTGLKQGQQTINWVQSNFSTLKQAAEFTSSHLKLVSIEPTLIGCHLWLNCIYTTGEAMGMNMVTIATQAMVSLIKQHCHLDCIALSGNGCVDKKPAWNNFIRGRGVSTQAEVILNRDIVASVLKTTPEAMVDVVLHKDWLGSISTGSMGFNGHFANILAAIFLATGQDLGHIAECAIGITTAEVINQGLYFHISLPDLMIGTVGGGTHLPTQQTCLQLLGLGNQPGDKFLFARIIAATVLAGELSLTAALASGQLAVAHQRLGRSK